ncbi:transposase, partial [Escherichia coli]|uniref:transposase n=1 Tax=Escherichia coli TaxID=562 RepID=UPI00311B2472
MQREKPPEWREKQKGSRGIRRGQRYRLVFQFPIREPRKNYSNEFKLRMVELASQPGACVAQIARENGVNDNVIFKW